MQSRKGYVSISTCTQEKRAVLQASPRYLLFRLVHNLQLTRLLGSTNIQVFIILANFAQFFMFNLRVFLDPRFPDKVPKNQFEKLWRSINFKFMYTATPLQNAILLLTLDLFTIGLFISLARISTQQHSRYIRSKQLLLKSVQ